MRSFLGYPEKTKHDPVPSYGKETTAIKRMLTRKFSPGDILSCWKDKVTVRGQFVSMAWINQDIAEFVRGAASRTTTVKPGLNTERGGDTPAKKRGGEPQPDAVTNRGRKAGRQRSAEIARRSRPGLERRRMEHGRREE